jgi:hypothetical protein
MKTKLKKISKAVESGHVHELIKQDGRTFWAVMKAHSWDCLECSGLPVRMPEDGPHRFIPVFNTREQAVAWAGSDEHVYAMTTVKLD